MISTIMPLELTLDAAVSASLSTTATLLLIALLVLKEVASNMEGEWQALGRFLNIAIVPLSMTFLITTAIRVLDAVR